jgi:lysosomal acid lipase/cholesteryl ester hydrolase
MPYNISPMVNLSQNAHLLNQVNHLYQSPADHTSWFNQKPTSSLLNLDATNGRSHLADLFAHMFHSDDKKFASEGDLPSEFYRTFK